LFVVWHQNPLPKLEYLCPNPTFLATCLYGIPFIILGNTAGNAIVFAENALLAAQHKPTNAETRGIAIAAITFACLIHAVWRRGGLYLNNLFGVMKAALLLLLFIVGVVSAAGGIKRSGSNDGEGAAAAANVPQENFDAKTSFQDRAGSAYGYTEAFLGIIFTYGGFNQANYVCKLSPSHHAPSRLKSIF
jgi:amino acid transporter